MSHFQIVDRFQSEETVEVSIDSQQELERKNKREKAKQSNNSEKENILNGHGDLMILNKIPQKFEESVLEESVVFHERRTDKFLNN